ncbi:replication restart helicase PriA [Limisalsivibrio acetivorans]|uniref:replication restart helicase PriA n=1 Tax=Limisalsivibrio acetivorans TaxID=1304888 RepID=UPI0003B52CBD|nr:primosomal protein N' [Limisalsivibrio acetivorans]
MTYYDVLIPVPLSGTFTYVSTTPLKRGMRIKVPLGRRVLPGIVLRENKEPKEGIKYKEPIEIYDNEPVFNDGLLTLFERMGEYYASSPGLVMQGCISKNIITSPISPQIPQPVDVECELELNEEQQRIYDDISADMDCYSAHLVHGVTGSGKTEVFIELAKKVMAEGKKVIYLVPEISLTPQMVSRISARLGFKVLSYHSKLTPKQRRESFWSFAKGTFKFLIGARSALFVPAEDIGLIIVDEEHETSYKQEEAPAHNTRDMAVLYASILKVPVVLGSATPSLESMHNVKEGRYKLHRLRLRHAAEMPQIEIVDLKESDLIDNIISERLYDELSATLERGEQAILLINRKGYSHTLYCRNCGNIVHCPNCSVALTWYKSRNKCKCHYCAEEFFRPVCTSCGDSDVTDYGAGTERIKEILEELLGEKVLQMDTDSVTSLSKLDKMLDSFGKGEYRVLVGTQIVAKGLHFPNVTLAGVLNLDNVFSLPDFRAYERAFQLLTQLSGRSGRGAGKNGKVIIQTNNPELDLFRIVRDDPDSFYDKELAKREAFGYPPFTKVARLIFSHTDEGKTARMADIIRNEIGGKLSNLKVLGPSPAPVSKIKNKYRYTILIKHHDGASLNSILKRAIVAFMEKKTESTMIMKVDRDPVFFM